MTEASSCSFLTTIRVRPDINGIVQVDQFSRDFVTSSLDLDEGKRVGGSGCGLVVVVEAVTELCSLRH